MKRRLSILLTYLFYVAIIIILLVNDHQQKEWQQFWDNRIGVLFDQQAQLDSLYHDHLSQCSFIDRESVKVGRNGVLYSNYHKTEGKLNGK